METADGKVVLIRRSGNVGECAGMVVCPGGHPEPGALVMERPAAAEEQQAWQQAVRAELWNSVINEIEEETGISKSELEQPVFIGIVRRVENHRPNMMFVVRCRLSAEEVKLKYRDASDQYESTGVFILDKEDLIDQALRETSLRMPGCHRGGVQLYATHLKFRDNK